MAASIRHRSYLRQSREIRRERNIFFDYAHPGLPPNLEVTTLHAKSKWLTWDTAEENNEEKDRKNLEILKQEKGELENAESWNRKAKTTWWIASAARKTIGRNQTRKLGIKRGTAGNTKNLQTSGTARQSTYEMKNQEWHNANIVWRMAVKMCNAYLKKWARLYHSAKRLPYYHKKSPSTTAKHFKWPNDSTTYRATLSWTRQQRRMICWS